MATITASLKTCYRLSRALQFAVGFYNQKGTETSVKTTAVLIDNLSVAVQYLDESVTSLSLQELAESVKKTATVASVVGSHIKSLKSKLLDYQNENSLSMAAYPSDEVIQTVQSIISMSLSQLAIGAEASKSKSRLEKQIEKLNNMYENMKLENKSLKSENKEMQKVARAWQKNHDEADKAVSRFFKDTECARGAMPSDSPQDKLKQCRENWKNNKKKGKRLESFLESVGCDTESTSVNACLKVLKAVMDNDKLFKCEGKSKLLCAKDLSTFVNESHGEWCTNDETFSECVERRFVAQYGGSTEDILMPPFTKKQFGHNEYTRVSKAISDTMDYISEAHKNSREVSMFHVVYLCSLVLACCVKLEKTGLLADSQYSVHHISRVLEYCLSEHFDLVDEKRRGVMDALNVKDAYKELRDVTVKKDSAKTALWLL